MKSIWTPGPVQWSHPGKSREPILWSLWVVALVLLGLWLLGIATGVSMGGWIHLLAGAAVLVGVVCVYLVFKYGEFLERPLFKRIHGARFRRFRKRP